MFCAADVEVHFKDLSKIHNDLGQDACIATLFLLPQGLQQTLPSLLRQVPDRVRQIIHDKAVDVVGLTLGMCKSNHPEVNLSLVAEGFAPRWDEPWALKMIELVRP